MQCNTYERTDLGGKTARTAASRISPQRNGAGESVAAGAAESSLRPRVHKHYHDGDEPDTPVWTVLKQAVGYKFGSGVAVKTRAEEATQTKQLGGGVEEIVRQTSQCGVAAKL